MRALSLIQTFQAACQYYGQPGLYLNVSTPELELEEIVKAAPFLDKLKNIDFVLNGGGIIVCDNVEEQRRLYRQVVGDDGPTKSNPYTGPARIYALTCDKDGKLITENT